MLEPKGVKTELRGRRETAERQILKAVWFGGEQGGQVTTGNGAMSKLAADAQSYRFAPDEKAASAAQEVAGDKTLTSNDRAVRAARPKVTGIFVGYGQ